MVTNGVECSNLRCVFFFLSRIVNISVFVTHPMAFYYFYFFSLVVLMDSVLFIIIHIVFMIYFLFYTQNTTNEWTVYFGKLC